LELPHYLVNNKGAILLRFSSRVDKLLRLSPRRLSIVGMFKCTCDRDRHHARRPIL
jgi:hypothetical protein